MTKPINIEHTAAYTIFFVWVCFASMVAPQNTIAQNVATQQQVSLIQHTTHSIDSTDEKVDEALTNESIWAAQISYFGKSMVLVKALIIVTLTAVVVMLVLLVLILLHRNKIKRESALTQFLREKYQGLILDYLFGEHAIEDFFDIASDNFRRQVLIDQIIDISINIKGESGEKLQQLFLDLGLLSYSLKKVKSRKWHIQVKGFKELAFMGRKEGNVQIYKALQSKNDILRMEAQIALVRLSEGDPFAWLSDQVQHFSVWEQMTLHGMLVQHNIPVAHFSQWLDSPNYSVVMFALRMIREFKQMDHTDLIFETLHHPKECVRQLAVEVCGDLELKSSLKIMKSRYKYESSAIRLEILKAMGKMPDESMLGFLKLVLDKEDNVQLQIESTKAIENMGSVGVEELQKLMKSEYKNYQIIIRHVLDKRII